MKKRKKKSSVNIGRIIAALIWILIVAGLLFLNFTYDPDAQYKSSFFDDVAKTMQWR